MPVVGRGREKQAMLEELGELAYRLGELARYGVARPGRGRGVVGLVQDQKAPGTERAHDIPQPRRIGLIRQEAMGDDEA